MTKFAVVVADPPWPFGDKLPGASRGAGKNYELMSLADIRNMSGQLHTSNGYQHIIRLCGSDFEIANDALLFMWRVSAMQEEAFQVVRSWGFVPKSEIVWVKKTVKGQTHFGMGRYVRASHETCIIAAKGKAISLIQNHSTRSVFEATVGEHSEKPKAFYDIVEALTTGPRLELFARKQREGWTVAGNEVPA